MTSGIPVRLNLILVVGVLLAQAGLLVAASHAPPPWLWCIAPAFATLFLTNYALMHEGSHGALHADPRINRWLSALTGLTFPAAASLMRVTHVVHHRCNRTDHEMFDCYYPGDRIWLKRAQWYSILTGLFYLVIPIGSIVVGFCRPLVMSRPFKSARSAQVLFDDFDRNERGRVRAECALLVLAWGPAFALGWLAPGPTVLLLALGGLNWSTRQYVTHAWSPRRVRDGAHNLRVSRLMDLVLLHGQWDRVHHRFPTVSWIHLPRLGRRCAPPISYNRQWLSLWWGPRPADQPGPGILHDLTVSR